MERGGSRGAAVPTSLLALNGCDNKGPAEKAPAQDGGKTRSRATTRTSSGVRFLGKLG